MNGKICVFYFFLGGGEGIFNGSPPLQYYTQNIGWWLLTAAADVGGTSTPYTVTLSVTYGTLGTTETDVVGRHHTLWSLLIQVSRPPAPPSSFFIFF